MLADSLGLAVGTLRWTTRWRSNVYSNVDKIEGKVQGLKLKRFYGLLEDPHMQKHQQVQPL